MVGLGVFPAFGDDRFCYDLSMFRHASANLLKIFITSSYAPVTPFVIKNHGKSTNEDPPCLEKRKRRERKLRQVF